jgi:hypothetical protein
MTAPLAWDSKDPDDIDDFDIDWSARLVTDETISTSTWLLPSGITRVSDTNTATTTTIILAAGSAGALYTLTNRITTSGGRTLDQDVNLLVEGNGPASTNSVLLYPGSPLYDSEASIVLEPSGSEATDSANFAAAALLGRNVVMRDPDGTKFRLTGTIPVYARVKGLGTPEIIFRISQSSQRGLWGKSGGGMEFFKITHIVDGVRPTNGSFGCAITTSVYADDHEECRSFNLSNIWFDCSAINGGDIWNTISVMGNTHSFKFSNLTFTGDYLIPILCHWGFNRQGTAQVQVSYHPRLAIFENIFCLNKADATDSGNLLNEVCYGIYLSGVHDVVITNHVTRGGKNGLIITPGDHGDWRADLASAGRTMSGIVINGFTAENVPGKMLWVNGVATLVSYYPARWVGTNHDMNVTITGITCRRGNNNDNSTNPGQILVSHCKNVSIRGMDIANINENPFANDNDPVVEVQSSINCDIQGTTRSAFGWQLTSGRNIRVNASAYCSRATATSGLVGIRVVGGILTATAESAVSAGGTSVVFDVRTDIYPGMLFEYNGTFFEFTSGAYYETDDNGLSVAANDNITHTIQPAPIAIPNGATITLHTGVNGARIDDGEVSGFFTHVEVASSDARMPNDVRIVGTKFSRSQKYDIDWQNGEGEVNGTSHEFSNMAGLAGIAQINIAGGLLDVKGPKFNRRTRWPKNAYHVFRQTAASNLGEISGCLFGGVDELQSGSKGAIRLGAQGNPPDLIFGNRYAPSMGTRIVSASLATRLTIGQTEFISDTAPLTTGDLEDGTYTFDNDAAAAGVGISVITTEGTSGTLNGGATTGTITDQDQILVVNSTTGLAEGNRITIVGANGTYKVWRIDGLNVYLTSKVTTTVGGATLTAAAVAFAAPVSKTLATAAA